VTSVRLILVLSENWTILPGSDLDGLVGMARAAEDAGFDGVMVSEHVAMGTGADANGLPPNPREYALPGNQDPRTPWPSSLVVLSAVAAETTRLRLIAGAIIAPLRHPLVLAKDLATLDLLSGGRLVVQPTVGWHRAEYDALGVPFEERGSRLDEHLEAWRRGWAPGPASFRGRHFAFDGVFVEPKPFREGGPPLWFGGGSVRDRLLRRLTEHGSGFNPLGRPSPSDLERIARAMDDAGRDVGELELVGGTRGTFAGRDDVADLGLALASVPEQVARGFATICVKPSQFVDRVDRFPAFCREVVDRVDALAV
jgi:probable F420-dependent oxidoreductase